MHFRINRFKLLVICKSFFFFAVVLHDNIFIIGICGFCFDWIDTPFQIINMIFIRNNDRDQWVIIPQEFCPVESQELSLAHFHFNTDPVIMRLHRPLSRIKCIQLALRILRCGIFMASPVIQDLRNMMDLFRSRMFHTTEDKVIILRSVKLPA